MTFNQFWHFWMPLKLRGFPSSITLRWGDRLAGRHQGVGCRWPENFIDSPQQDQQESLRVMTRGCTSRAQLTRDRERAQARLMSFWSTSSMSLNKSQFLLYLSLIQSSIFSLVRLQQFKQPLLVIDMALELELAQKVTQSDLNVV